MSTAATNLGGVFPMTSLYIRYFRTARFKSLSGIPGYIDVVDVNEVCPSCKVEYIHAPIYLLNAYVVIETKQRSTRRGEIDIEIGAGRVLIVA